jgi:hypothetical protein
MYECPLQQSPVTRRPLLVDIQAGVLGGNKLEVKGLNGPFGDVAVLSYHPNKAYASVSVIHDPVRPFGL